MAQLCPSYVGTEISLGTCKQTPTWGAVLFHTKEEEDNPFSWSSNQPLQKAAVLSARERSLKSCRLVTQETGSRKMRNAWVESAKKRVWNTLLIWDWARETFLFYCDNGKTRQDKLVVKLMIKTPGFAIHTITWKSVDWQSGLGQKPLSWSEIQLGGEDKDLGSVDPGNPRDSPEPQTRSVWQNFSCTCYWAASRAHHLKCVLPRCLVILPPAFWPTSCCVIE